MASDITSTSTRRSILAGAAGVIPALSLPALAETDPIFAAIERHRLAEAAYVQAFHIDDRAFGELGDESHGHFAALLRVTPTTAAGCAAALLHLSQYAAEYGDGLFGNCRDEVALAGNEWLARVAAVLESNT